jgi:thioredoxin 1
MSNVPLTFLSLEQLILSEKNATNRLIVLDCYADWCGPCKRIAPEIDRLSAKYNGQIMVLKADIEECDDIAESFRVQSLPTLLFFRHGTFLDKIEGANLDLIHNKINLYAF